MRIWTIGLAFLLIPATGKAAYFNGSARGTTSAEFLQLGVGARALAMGEAYSAVADEASALYWNPAALTAIPGGSLTLMHAVYVGSSFYDYAAFAQNLGNGGSLGISGQFLSIGNITQTDALGNDLSSLNPHDLAVSLGYAHTFLGVSLGLSGKLIRSTLLTTAQTEAVDVGLLSPKLCEDRVRLALVATNLGGQLKFEREGAPLPMTFRAGSQFKLSKSVLFSVDGVAPKDNRAYAAAGMEFRGVWDERSGGALRVGYNTSAIQDLGGLSGASFGLGMNLESFSVDYALLPLGPLGFTHRISLSFVWGASRAQTRRFR